MWRSTKGKIVRFSIILALEDRFEEVWFPSIRKHIYHFESESAAY